MNASGAADTFKPDSNQLLMADGHRVCVSPATYADIDPYRVAMTASAPRIGRWNPVNPTDLIHHLQAQSPKHRTFLIRDVTGASGRPKRLVGCVNVTNVVEGRFRSAAMGYNAFDPYAGRGFFAEGLALVVGIALREGPTGMDLHRLEANVRPGNVASAATLRSLGFRRERAIRRMLWLADGLDGQSAWRDHDSYAITREEWPAPRYAANDIPSGVLLVSKRFDPGFVTAMARELGGIAFKDIPLDVGAKLAAASAAPVLWQAGDTSRVQELLAVNGIPNAPVVDELCEPWMKHGPAGAVKAALAVRHLLV